MEYRYLVLTCAQCEQEFLPAKVGFDAVEGMVMIGVCPKCGMPNQTETTLRDVILTVQHFELTTQCRPDNLAEMVVPTSRPH